MSVSDISTILAGQRYPAAKTWLKLLKAAQALEVEQQQIERANQTLLATITEKCNQQEQGLRRIARAAGIDPANLSHILNRKRNLTRSIREHRHRLLRRWRSARWHCCSSVPKSAPVASKKTTVNLAAALLIL